MLKNQQARPAVLAVLGLAMFALALGLDLWTKHWAWTQLRPTGEVVELARGWVELDFAHNRGTSFSLVREVEHPLVFLPITVIVVTLTMAIALRSPGVGRLRVAALGIACSGALGNLHDRLWRIDELGRHGVVDFIRINYPWGGSWPTFNVADTALVVGTVLLMWSLWQQEPEIKPRSG